MASGVTQAIEYGVNSLPALDPFKEIDPMESYVSFKEHQQYLRADREHAKCFFSWNGLEEEEREETADDTYCIESVAEGDQD